VKPVPVIVISCPLETVVGLTITDMVVTVNGAEASTGAPDGTSARMLYGPAATEGMVRVAVNVPVADAVTVADVSTPSH
jgi:hypothetical protein